jgi:hypothetical protein
MARQHFPQCCKKLTVQSLFVTFSEVLQESHSITTQWQHCPLCCKKIAVQYLSANIAAVHCHSTIYLWQGNTVRSVARNSQCNFSVSTLSDVLQETHSTIALGNICRKKLTNQYLYAIHTMRVSTAPKFLL